MKRCPECGRTFTNNTLINCLNDGTVLVEDVPAPPPYFGAPATAVPPTLTDTPGFAELPPSEAPSTATYTDTPLSAIPELQSPEIQAALKEALTKAGMSGLLDAGSAHSAISIKTRITTGSNAATGPSETPFFSAGTVPPAFTQVPRRKRSPWGRLIFWLVLLLAVFFGYHFLHSKADVPADVVAAVKGADDAEASTVRTLDPRPLASAYTGPALARELGEVAALKAAHRTQEDHLTAQEFSAFKPSADGSKAQVDVTETWDTDTYSEPAHTVLKQESGDVSPQTVYLTRTAGGWRVEKIVFHHS